jgi:hypothetical protein
MISLALSLHDVKHNLRRRLHDNHNVNKQFSRQANLEFQRELIRAIALLKVFPLFAA